MSKLITGAPATISALAIAFGAAAAPGPVLHISSHLDDNAQVSVDGKPAVTAPGDGSVETPIAGGAHKLQVTAPHRVSYAKPLMLKPSMMMHWHGRSYWCVNLLKDGLEPYSKAECEEEVEDGG
jgi:hypothetical protein